MIDAEAIAARLARMRARIDAAARRAGRSGDDVRIVAVTKKLGLDAVRAAYAAGQREFGENYVQEATAKIDALADEMPDARWHLIGRLQSNKAAVGVRSFALLHGVDSMSTVAALSRAADRSARRVDVLLQIRLGERGADGAAAKSDAGVRGGIETSAADAFLKQAWTYDRVRFVGLMGVADPDLPARPQFAALRQLAKHLAGLGLANEPIKDLSMGMTDDFEDAVAEGATIVRIGTAIFGE